MDSRSYVWRIRVRSAAHLDSWIRDSFASLQLRHEDDGSTVLTGTLPDMSAVYGFFLQLRDAGVVLLSLRIHRENPTAGGGSGGH